MKVVSQERKRKSRICCYGHSRTALIQLRALMGTALISRCRILSRFLLGDLSAFHFFYLSFLAIVKAPRSQEQLWKLHNWVLWLHTSPTPSRRRHISATVNWLTTIKEGKKSVLGHKLPTRKRKSTNISHYRKTVYSGIGTA